MILNWQQEVALRLDKLYIESSSDYSGIKFQYSNNLIIHFVGKGD